MRSLLFTNSYRETNWSYNSKDYYTKLCISLYRFNICTCDKTLKKNTL